MYLAGLPHHGSPLAFPSNSHTLLPVKPFDVVYSGLHPSLEGRGQVVGVRAYRNIKRGVSYMHDKRVQNELFTLEYVLPCVSSLEGVGAKEHKINCVGHG